MTYLNGLLMIWYCEYTSL